MKRYRLVVNTPGGARASMVEHPAGEYVAYNEGAAILATHAATKDELRDIEAERQHLVRENKNLQSSIEILARRLASPSYQPLTHQQFLQQYVLARANANDSALDGSQAAIEAEKAWRRLVVEVGE